MSKIMAKKVFQKISENVRKGHKVSVSKALREVGYSYSYSAKPQLFTKTKQWTELMAEYLPDELIISKHRELLGAAEIQHYIFPRTSKKLEEHSKLTSVEIKAIVESVPGCRLIYIKRDKTFGDFAFYQTPDNKSRKDGIDMAYKLNDKYAPEKIQMTKRKYQDLSNEELMDRINTIRNFLLKKKK